ncbi:MAG: translation elongation factor Ts [Bacteroidetes bacterium]|nr:translation elongation factor Ts [Bacteroidota bacterium]
MSITAADVNKLRQQTGAGMMDCKKALVEAEGDFEKAIEVLRKKGQKVAANRSDRTATEGFVYAHTNGNAGVLIALNCETDFVAKNEEFVGFAQEVAALALNHQCDSIESINATNMADGRTVLDHITEKIGKIGEKIEIGVCRYLNAPELFGYNHPGNRVATLVGLNKNGSETIAQAAKDVAMQAAAMAPVALDKEDVSAETVQKEMDIAIDMLRTEGKPEDKIEMIAKGKLEKFFKESTLLNQEFIKNNKQSVRQYLESVDKGLTVTAFHRYSLQ